MRGVRRQTLREAQAGGWALAAFSTYTLESSRAVCQGAEQLGLPVILQAGASTFAGVGRSALAGMSLALAESSDAEVGVHLDHSTDLAEITACVEAGYTSVMVDGSALPFERNIELTPAAVAIAHPAGVWVEAELGHVPGDENISRVEGPEVYTDPAQAAEFAQRTGVDALAVAVGNVHGMSSPDARLDIAQLAAIAAATPTPLVLHGASGVSDDNLRAALACGVVKVNINTELRRAYLGAIRGFAARNDSDNDLALQRDALAAMTEVVVDKMSLLANARATGAQAGVG